MYRRFDRMAPLDGTYVPMEGAVLGRQERLPLVLRERGHRAPTAPR
jgi:hypothetical protein